MNEKCNDFVAALDFPVFAALLDKQHGKNTYRSMHDKFKAAVIVFLVTKLPTQ